jgi:predicted O-methyltransferase YrrM
MRGPQSKPVMRLLLLGGALLLAFAVLQQRAPHSSAAAAPAALPRAAQRVHSAALPAGEAAFPALLAAAAGVAAAPHVRAVMEALSFAAEQAVPAHERATLFDGMGQIYQLPQEVEFYTAAARLPGVATICEVGFNAGHSAAVFLLANPESTYVGFDTMGLRWSAASLAFAQRLFPGRVRIVPGLSTDTLPAHAAPRCDLLSIDGEHAGETPFLDIANGRAASHAGGYVLMDDWSSTSPDVKAAWARALSEGLLAEVMCVDDGVYIGRYHKAWCLGRYV